MPRSLLIILFVCIGFGTESLAGGSGSFTGLWDASNGDVSDFSLDLVQTGNRIEGYHTSIADRGKRIDAVERSDGTPSITGTVSGGVAHVRFQSGYDESGSGEAVLTLQGNKLEWKITKSSGIHYLPMKSVLQLQKNNRTNHRPSQPLWAQDSVNIVNCAVPARVAWVLFNARELRNRA